MSVLSLLGCGSASDYVSNTAGAGGSIEDLRAAPSGWKTGCVIESGGTSSLESKNTFIVDAVLNTIIYYTDSTCTTADEGYRNTASVVTRGTSVTNSSATAYDIAFTKTEVRPLSGTAAARFNSNAKCGRTDWVNNGHWVDVTSSNCFNGGGTFFDIFKISGSTLVFGDRTAPNDATTEAKRPKVFESTSFTKF